jgi:hypothetical protein
LLAATCKTLIRLTSYFQIALNRSGPYNCSRYEAVTTVRYPNHLAHSLLTKQFQRSSTYVWTPAMVDATCWVVLYACMVRFSFVG